MVRMEDDEDAVRDNKNYKKYITLYAFFKILFT